MITFPNAKINLGLNIVEKRPDGYHNLETVFYPIGVEDALEVLPRDGQTNACTLTLSGQPLEGDPADNLVVKAYRLLASDHTLPAVDILLRKHIPSGAGLGGGSADAAFMLTALNQLADLHLSDDELEKYASVLGADCAFFVRNKPVFASGIGNCFAPVSLSLKNWHIVLVKPDIFVSTREAFARVKPQRPERALQEIVREPVSEWKRWMKNDFEESVFYAHPGIGKIKEELYAHGAVYAAMSGSGSSVFGLFEQPCPECRTWFPEGFVWTGAL